MAVGAGALATGTLGCKPAIQTISNATSKQNPTFGIPITENGMGSISGKATLDGENIVTGRVLFFFEKGPCLAVGVIDNGQYSAEGLAEGPCEMVVLLDPKGSMPAPFGNVQGGGSSAGKMKPGGGAGQPKGFPGGPPGPGGPQGPGAPPIPGGPGMKTPPGMPDNGAMPEPPQALRHRFSRC